MSYLHKFVLQSASTYLNCNDFFFKCNNAVIVTLKILVCYLLCMQSFVIKVSVCKFYTPTQLRIYGFTKTILPLTSYSLLFPVPHVVFYCFLPFIKCLELCVSKGYFNFCFQSKDTEQWYASQANRYTFTSNSNKNWSPFAKFHLIKEVLSQNFSYLIREAS